MRRWLFLMVALSLITHQPAAAQARAADSLRTLLRTNARPDTTRVRRLCALSETLMLSDVPQAIRVLKEELALSRSIGDPRGEGHALTRLGTAYRLEADFTESIRYAQQARLFFTRRHDLVGLANTCMQFSFIKVELGDLPTALKEALAGLHYAEEAGDIKVRTRILFSIGNIYVQLGDYKEALPMLQASLRSARTLGDKLVMASLLNVLGNTYQMLKNWPLALAYFRRSAELNQQLGDFRSVTIDETNISDLYLEQGNTGLALQHGFRARALARTNHDAYNLPPAELSLAKVYLDTHRLDSAIFLARHAFELSKHTRNTSRDNLSKASSILAKCYAQLGNFPQAYHYQRLWVAYKDTLSGEETQKKTAAMRYGYELDKKQAQIALLTRTRQLEAQKAARQRQQFYGLLAGLLGAVLVAGLLARNIHLKMRANRALNDKNDQIAHQRDDLNRTLTELKATQSQLVQSEKMVALAALMAGVAHEIQNPLNFVNNFSEVSLELVDELAQEQHEPARDLALETGLLGDLKQNLHKIHQHGSRAGAIVKGMLEHSHANTGQRRPVDLNAIVQDYLRLAYHGLQAKHRDFEVARPLALDPDLGLLSLESQEIGRVLLNLFANAFYAVQKKAALLGPAFRPEVRVETRRFNTYVELRVRDNGTGIAPGVVEKIFDPFFTTKPPGDGTGLGLSLSYDIVTKGYGGTLAVNTQEGEFTEFVVTLPGTTTPLEQPRNAVFSAESAS